MKKIFFLFSFLAFASCIFGQTKPTRNIGRETKIILDANTDIPVVIDSAGKKVGRLMTSTEMKRYVNADTVGNYAKYRAGLLPTAAAATFQNRDQYLFYRDIDNQNLLDTAAKIRTDLTNNINYVSAQSVEISAVTTLPTTAAAKIGNKQLYITATDTTEITYIGGNKWRADIVEGSATPLISITSGTQKIDFSNAVWKNTNISVVIGQTVDYSYQNNSWKPIKGNLSIMDYGADNTGAIDISAAFARALVYEKRIYFPKGTYRIDAALLTTLKEIEIIGETQDSVILNVYGGVTPFTIGSDAYVASASSPNNVIFRNLKIIDITNTSDIAINNKGVAELNIENCTFVNFNVQVQTEGAYSRSTYRKNKFYSPRTNAVFIKDRNNLLTIEGNIFGATNATQLSSTAIKLITESDNTGIKIKGNEFYSNGTEYKIDMRSTSPGLARGFELTGNWFEGIDSCMYMNNIYNIDVIRNVALGGKFTSINQKGGSVTNNVFNSCVYYFAGETDIMLGDDNGTWNVSRSEQQGHTGSYFIQKRNPNWVAPSSASDPIGVDGQMIANANGFYAKVSGLWKYIPFSNFNSPFSASASASWYTNTLSGIATTHTESMRRDGQVAIGSAVNSYSMLRLFRIDSAEIQLSTNANSARISARKNAANNSNQILFSPNNNVSAMILDENNRLTLNSYTSATSKPVTAIGQLVFDGNGNIGTQSFAATNAGEGSQTLNATIATNTNLSTTPFTITVSGAAVGDYVDLITVPDGNDLTDVIIKAWVSAENTVSYQIENKKSTSITFTNKIVKARVRR